MLLLLTFFSGIKLIFYAAFEVKITASSLFVLFETNKNEALEFLSSYINGTLIFILLFVPVLVFCIILFLKNKTVALFKIEY
ncbi:hypothetical protein ES676_10220 [Bizionia saleffrena]|uniref:Uncharacterized protein n=1 Tax=Bizionia saleffrena TaxID=291189 RepID=A0A8H2QE66_9FLAO|nr:hypothetical protein [Bizionia saleffrena]TYB73121.1 hypothetical protein ES676_10220 [Bizionia saleffrena]